MNRSTGLGYHNQRDNLTFSRHKKEQLFFENNYANPVITHPTDDEDDDLTDENANLPNEVESILTDSSRDQRPRTSTPAGHSSKNDTLTTSGDGLYHSSYRSDCQYDEEVLDVSKDTDNSTLNQSGGCELIGIFDSPDHPSSSKSSPQSNSYKERVPYTVQFSNDNTRPPSVDYTSICNDKQQEKIKDLEKLTTSLFNDVENLKEQVDLITRKLNAIQQACPIPGKETTPLTKESTDSPFDSLSRTAKSRSQGLSYHELSKSISAINQSFNKAKTDSHTIPNNPCNITTTSRNQTPSQVPRNPISSPKQSNFNGSLTTSIPSRRNNAYSSASSLLSETFKSNLQLNSPIPGHQHDNGQRTLSNKRDPRTCTSMLSLGSISNLSTLKRESTLDSTSNLSQVGSALTSWPSTSDFVSSKSRAREIFFSPDERLIRMILYNTTITMRLPNWVNNYSIEATLDPPPVQLKLDWVHGYRGRDCRCNIYHLPTGECVYFVASIIVLYNPEQRTQRHYLGHTETVKCIAVHPNKLIIASGQSASIDKRDKRPVVRVWNTVSLATLRIITFNEDFDRPICCLAFSKHDCGATLAVVDESNDHTITLLDWQRPKNWRIAEANSGHEPVFAIDFHPIDKYSLVAVGKSSVNFWDVRGMTMMKKAGLFDKYDKPKYVLCLTFNDLGETITGDSNGNILVWPRGGNRPRKITQNAHHGGVFSVIAMKDGSYLSGGRDRRIVEWDENFHPTGRIVEIPEHLGGVRHITYARGSRVLIGTLKNSILLGSMDENFSLIMQGHSEATSALAIHPTKNEYLTGGFDEQIHLFDAETHDILWSKCLMTPATSACFSPDHLLLIVGSTSGKWLVLDLISQEILFTKHEGSGTINCVKFSPSGEFFAMGSTDGHIYIYNPTEGGNKFRRVGDCAGHSGPVKDIDWSTDSLYLQSQSMNLELLYWKANNCCPIEDFNIIGDLKWATHNCTLGFSVIGIWSDSIDSAMVNHCDKSNKDDVLVSASDNGHLNIYEWPPCYSQCSSHKYYGNVDKFNIIKFLHDDSRLIAIGSKNCVTTEWIINRERP